MVMGRKSDLTLLTRWVAVPQKQDSPQGLYVGFSHLAGESDGGVVAGN